MRARLKHGRLKHGRLKHGRRGASAGTNATTTLRRVAPAHLAALALAASPQRALAHGGVTGMQDVVQDYGVFIFLIAVVLIGAGVLTWVLLSPQPDETEEEAQQP